MTPEEAAGLAHEMADYAQELARDLRVPEVTLLSLSTDSDWTAIIKAHAILEAASSEAIRRRVRRPALEPFLTDAPAGHRFKVVTKLVKLPDSAVRYVSRLSKLRNMVVHDCHHLDFTFAKYLAGLNKQDRSTILNELTLTQGKRNIQELFLLYPGMYLMLSTIVVVGYWLHSKQRHRAKPRVPSKLGLRLVK